MNKREDLIKKAMLAAQAMGIELSPHMAAALADSALEKVFGERIPPQAYLDYCAK